MALHGVRRDVVAGCKQEQLLPDLDPVNLGLAGGTAAMPKPVRMYLEAVSLDNHGATRRADRVLVAFARDVALVVPNGARTAGAIGNAAVVRAERAPHAAIGQPFVETGS